VNRTEESIADALAARAQAVDPASVRPLPAVEPAVERRRALRHTWLAPVAAGVAIAVIAAVVGIVSHRAGRTGNGPDGGGTSIEGALQSIDVLSPSDIWAVGSRDIGLPNGLFKPLIMHWDGTRWRQVAAPSVPTENGLVSISGTSADDLWAVGTWYRTHPRAHGPMIMHWNGKKWYLERFAADTMAGFLRNVTALSASDAWAVGSAGTEYALLLHWNGTSWNRVRTPFLGYENVSNPSHPRSPPSPGLAQVAAVSADDVWAVGENGRQALIVHWNGSSWTRESVPRSKFDWYETALTSVAADSARTVWAVGFSSGKRQLALVMRWAGASWQVVPGPGNRVYYQLSAVAVVSPHNVWTVGSAYIPNRWGSSTAAILHWNGTSWKRFTGSRASFPGGVSDLAAVSADNIWAVGYRTIIKGTGRVDVPQILHWNGTTWNTVGR
jgi:hypothetical protein